MSETGKIEYAPDYKSSKCSHYFNEQMKDPEFAAAYRKVSAEEDNRLKKALEREWKLNELKNAVVEAAKAYEAFLDDDKLDPLLDAVKALGDFEWEHKS